MFSILKYIYIYIYIYNFILECANEDPEYCSSFKNVFSEEDCRNLEKLVRKKCRKDCGLCFDLSK